MPTSSTPSIIRSDVVIDGDISGAAIIEVFGQVLGGVSAGRLVVHPGGRVAGRIRVDDAEVNGAMQGQMAVRSLLAIGATGVVEGDVRYGRIAVSPGGALTAELRNIPPELAGDFAIAVRRGRAVRLTTADVTAIDPDSGAESLVFTVSGAAGGWVARDVAPATAIAAFGQIELAEGRVLFVHDGSPGATAGFDVTVTDGAGGSSGPPRRIEAAVLDG